MEYRNHPPTEIGKFSLYYSASSAAPPSSSAGLGGHPSFMWQQSLRHALVRMRPQCDQRSLLAYRQRSRGLVNRAPRQRPLALPTI